MASQCGQHGSHRPLRVPLPAKGPPRQHNGTLALWRLFAGLIGKIGRPKGRLLMLLLL